MSESNRRADRLKKELQDFKVALKQMVLRAEELEQALDEDAKIANGEQR